jgi:hypothetical protein
VARDAHTPLRANFFGGAELSGHEINITNHAGVIDFALTTALRNFFSQIRQPHIDTVAINQSLLSILARASAFSA